MKIRSLILSLLAVVYHLGVCADDEFTVDTSHIKVPEHGSIPEQMVSEDKRLKAPRKVLNLFEVGNNVYVRALKLDETRHSLWVGTSVGVHEVGLADYEIKQTFTREQGLANEYVFAIGIDQQGYKWFGTNAGGASRYKDGQWQTFFPMHGLADYWVYSFTSQQDGTWWIGTWAGANRFDIATGEFTTYVKELINEWVYGLGVDSQDRVWFGTEGGISMFDGKDWHAWTHADGLGAANSNNLPASKNTGLGTRNRHDLGVLSGGQATYNPNYVFALHIDADDVIWAGTWGGGVSDGLTDTNVYALEVTPNGDIWAGIKGAVVRIGWQDRPTETEG